MSRLRDNHKNQVENQVMTVGYYPLRGIHSPLGKIMEKHWGQPRGGSHDTSRKSQKMGRVFLAGCTKKPVLEESLCTPIFISKYSNQKKSISKQPFPITTIENMKPSHRLDVPYPTEIVP